MSALVLGIVLAAGPAPKETAAAREQARLCERLTGEASVGACRAALALGLGPERADAVRQLLALRLASLERWEELVETYREAARIHPGDPDAQLRLGSALLLAVDEPREALGPLREAARLRAHDPRPLVLLGTALNALDRHEEAVAALQEAQRLDPAALDGRPAARAVLGASRDGRRWP